MNTLTACPLARALPALLAVALLLAVVGCDTAGMDTYTAGVLAANEGEYLDARSKLAVAVDQNPEFAEAWLSLGIVYLKLADAAVKEDKASPESYEVRNLLDKAYLALLRARALIEAGNTVSVRNYSDSRKLEIANDRIKSLKEHYTTAHQEPPDPDAEIEFD